MIEAKSLLINSCVIVDSIAFEVLKVGGLVKLLATDMKQPNHKASFVLRGDEIILSVSSFREELREWALFEAVRINKALLLDEVKNA